MRPVRGIVLRPGESEDRLKDMAARTLGVSPDEVAEVRILKKSLDARKKGAAVWQYTVGLRLRGDPPEEPDYEILPVAEPELRPVIAGFGPAGMFAALLLARAGARPVVLERGPDIRARRERIDAFHGGGPLDPEANVQFGEGGAGAFSDGKLNTGTHDGRIRFVLRQLFEHGAPESVTWDAKPHVGTDVLPEVVRSIRLDVERHGGEVRFMSRLVGIETDNHGVSAVKVENCGVSYALPCRRLILAVGHSARDTFELLRDAGVAMTAKAFSMGARIEHSQRALDICQYGAPRGDLPPADYTLSARLPGGGGAYTFCMCPGGYVFAAASEPGGVVTNGMSYAARDGKNCNSALLVGVSPESFPHPGPLGGVYWQRDVERAAFLYGGGDYSAPCQTVGDFLKGRPSTGGGAVTPTYRPGVRWGDLRRVLPEAICDGMAAALPLLARKLPLMGDPCGVLTGPETRSSSPVRILRDAGCQSELRGLYPCGEGAGWAGGITSSAVDGLRCAEAVLQAYQNGEK